MGLLHAIQQAGNRGSQWELSSLASSLGLPAPPQIKLPELPPIVGACDFTSLATQIGQAAADALKAQLLDPAVQGLMTSDLQDKRAQLLSYLAGLDTQKNALLAQVTSATQQGGVLASAQGTLGGVRTALGGVTGSPVGTEVMKALETACPTAAGLVTYAETALSTLDSGLSGVSSYLSTLTSQIASLTSLQSLGQDALAEIDAHLDILPALFTSIGGP